MWIASMTYVHADNTLIVAIDPGHTEKYYGATSASGEKEYTYNIKMSNILLNTLNNTKNIKAFIINPAGKSIKLKARTAMAEQRNADIFISIHHDSVQKKYLTTSIVNGKKNHFSKKFKGYSLFVSKKNNYYTKSFLLAENIGRGIKEKRFTPTLHHAEKIKRENRILLDTTLGIYRFDDLIVLKSADIPSVLIECGIIVNPQEESSIKNTNYHQRLSNGILAGLKTYMQSAKQ